MVDVRMNYGSMEKMQKEFEGAASQLEDTRNEMQKVSQMMEDGALLGAGGDAYRDAINSQLIPALKELNEKMLELAQDIKGAVEATRDGISTAKSRFK